jgi:hypothetical protein
MPAGSPGAAFAAVAAVKPTAARTLQLNVLTAG